MTNEAESRRLLEALRCLDRVIIEETRTAPLIQRACLALRDSLGYQEAWIVLLDPAGELRLAAGSDPGVAASLTLPLPHCFDQAMARTGLVVVEEPVAECRNCLLGCKRQGRVGLACRISRGDRIHGVLAVSADASSAVEETDGALILDLADDLGHALDNLEADRALRLSEKRLRSLVRAAPVGIGIVKDRVFLEVNQRFCDLLEYTRDQLVGQSARLIYPTDEDFEFVGTVKHAMVEQAGVGTVETRMITRTGKILNILLSSAYMDPDDHDAGLTFTALDITDLRSKEAQLQQAQKMEAVGRLAAGVAHDFNNQLTVIQGYAQLMLESRSGAHAVEESLQQILKATGRARSTTDHLLSFSRRRALAPTVVDLGELLRDLEKPVSRLIGEEINLSVVVEPRLGNVRVDRVGLEQALMNLIVNARDAMSGGGRLTLKAINRRLTADEVQDRPGLHEGRHVEIQVIDTGSGMDQQTLDQAFEPFFTTKERGKGTGLGMPMVLGFVQQSQGHLSVQSKPGDGTRISILLPHVQAEPDSPPLEGGAEARERKLVLANILVVEDEPGVRAFVTRALEMAGHRTFEAAGPAEALSLILSGELQPDLIVSDIVLPDMRGNEMLERLAASGQTVPAILITGYSEPIQTRYPVLHKPFERRQLLSLVQETLQSGDAAKSQGPTS